MKRVRYSEYAEKRIVERKIDKRWIVATLQEPERREGDPRHAYRERLYRRVSEFGGRWMRLVIEEAGNEVMVVSVFFDRGAGRRL